MEGERKTPPDTTGGGRTMDTEEEGKPPESFVGSYVGKGKGRGIRLGKVASYAKETGLFAVSYEDDCCEQMDRYQLGKILLSADKGATNPNLTRRKRKLDQVITYGGSKRPNTRSSSSSSKRNDNATAAVAASDYRAAQASPISRLASKDAAEGGHTLAVAAPYYGATQASPISRLASEDAAEGGHTSAVVAPDYGAAQAPPISRLASEDAAEGGHTSAVAALDYGAAQASPISRLASEDAAEGGHTSAVVAPDYGASQASPISRLASEDAAEGGHTSPVSQMVTEDASEEADSSTNSCDDDDQTGGPQATSSSLRENTIVVVPLPPSSGDLGVPEESVSYLFSVYNFLRSFSLQLFLSPFGLHELVGCLNCTVQNSLLDAIHLSLMRVLRRHLQSLSSDGSEIASKCLRHSDWSLLDALTWPAILLEYLFIMGYAKGLTEKGFYFGVSAGEYYGLSVATKLEAMQILCDNVVDSEELRTELDTRVDKMEEWGEYDASDSIFPETENGPSRVHPRYSKTSACKTLEALEISVESKPVNPDSSKVLEMVDASSDCQDGNSDECRLCGMNGSLVCCDGCPSAYHVRCIGLYKSFLPDGLWFCPECTVNKLGKPSSRICRGASGAEIFGMDANGRVFLGTCNYLLVVGASSNSEPICRYYNQGDVSKVLTVLYLTAETALIYADICRGISRYWEVPLVTMQSGKPEPTKDPWVDREPAVTSISSSTTLPEGTANPLYGAEVEKLMVNLTEGSSDNRDVLSQKDFSTEAKGKLSSLVLLDKVDFPDSEKHLTASLDVCTNGMSEAADGTLCPVKERQFISGLSPLTGQKIYPGTHTMIHGHLGNDSVATDNFSYLNQPISAESSVILDAATCGLGNRNGIWKKDEHISTFSTKMEPVAISSDSRIWCHNNDEKFRIKSQTISSIKSAFKPQAYINLYVQGVIAATAAATLAVQASEERKVSEARVASNPRKAMAEKFALETKVFSMATSDFLWPSFEKIEATRAKCGWCSACSVTYRKGCLLNLAANKSSKRFVRNASVLRPNKPIDSHIPTIAAQIAHMEESLQGLIDGPLSDVAYNKQWRKLIREASSCRVLIFLLLELEKSIRGISFSAEWSKLVDDSGEFSSSLGAVRRSVPGQKHGPGRRCKKQYVASEAEADTSTDSSKTLQWWRGGRLSKIVFQKRVLSNSQVKKAGRQGGYKRIPGIHYPEVSGLPRRSRQLAWRASVQMSQNLSQLALQVRYLDAHIRWRDLVRPEDNPSDGKGSEVDAIAFRNAVICDKRITENRISYALTFAIQKHLPLRVTKNILETETTQDGNGKSWFSENHVPLFLIKEYEAKAGMKPLTCPPLNCREMLRSRGLPKLEIRQLKGQDDIFSYLIRKRDAVRCSTCQVYYQKDCTITSPAAKEGDLELFTCTKCYRMKFASLVGSSSKQNSNMQQHLQAKNQQQLLKGQNQQQLLKGQNQNQCIQRQNQLLTSTKLILKVGQNIAAQQVGNKEVQSEVRCSASGSKSERKRNISSSEYGLIWKRMKSDGSGKEDFRMNYIILKKREGINPLRDVTCCLCNKPYCADLMYICCELCLKWYHADAVELEEAKIFDLVGFKCCSCRRKRLPKCPYSDFPYKKPNVHQLAPFKVERNRFDLSEAQAFVHPGTLKYNLKVEGFDEDPLFYSLGKVELIEERDMASEVQRDEPRYVCKNQQKISVRRPQVKHEKGSNEFCATQSGQSPLTSSNPAEGEKGVNEALTTEEPNLMSDKLSPQVEWDCSEAWGFGDGDFGSIDLGDQLNDPESRITDTGYEPQTYFSLTDLLASDDGQIDDQYDVCTNISGDWSLDNSGTTYQDAPPYGSSGAYQMGTVNQFAVANKTALEGVACEKCKLNQPSPDLVCDICNMCVHSHCFPGEENKGAQWRCSGCRDWQ